jgi:catechol 2,3-dioxygenase-like lactoylglutathione lyase family enzyme
MLSHVFVPVTLFPRALAFYTQFLNALGLTLKFADADIPWAAWQAPSQPRPLFIIGHPYNGAPALPGNGHMVALLAATRAAVDQAHAAALAAGGTCDGPPGLRPRYHADYYGAYVLDPDGNKLGICCHEPQ